MRLFRPTSFALVSLFVLLAAVPALAAESPTDTTAPAQQDSAGQVQSGYEAAVPVDAPAATDVVQPWTTKFLVPTGLLIAVIAIFATVVMYFMKVVRTRYKVVE